MGATLPSPGAQAKTESEMPQFEKETNGTESSKTAETDEPKMEEAEAAQESESEPESDLELDNSGVIEPDAGEVLAMGNDELDVTEEMSDQSDEKRTEAMAAFSEGKFDEAVTLFTAAIELNPRSAILHAKRANALLKLNRPIAAIKDCDKAVQLNPDSAQGYKFRGRANRLLGNWEDAHHDLSLACKLDYDDTANEWLKEAEPNAKKIAEHKRKIERRKEDKALKAQQERVRKARAEYERKKKEEEEEAKARMDDGGDPFGGFPGMPGGMGGAGGGGPPGGMAGLAAMMNDPEIKELFEDPEVRTAFSEISQNPANILKYQSNPKVAKIIEKLQSKLGGGGGMPGGFPGGFPGAGGFPGGAAPPPSGPPPSAPDVDVD